MTSNAFYPGKLAMGAWSINEELLQLSQRLGGPLLGLDTSGPQGSLCMVAWRKGLVEEIALPAQAMPSESLVPTLAARFARSQLDPGCLRGLVVGLGPGSFTGLRVGLATAQGLALAAGIPLVGISSLAIVAAGEGPGEIAVALDARRGDLYCALYRVDEKRRATAVVSDAVRQPAVFAAELDKQGAPPAAVVGCRAEDFPALSERLEKSCFVPDFHLRVAFGILRAGPRLLDGPVDPIDALAPRYHRRSEAERQAGRS